VDPNARAWSDAIRQARAQETPQPKPVSSGVELTRLCRHCGALDTRKLGKCVVCDLAVCEKCGNVQHTHGERRVIHDSCLSKDESGFTMIKFVK
jgi:hypothetical protein